MEQQNPDGLPTKSGDELALDRPFSDPAHGPTAATLGRIAACHSDDALLLAVFQHFCRSRALFLVESAIQWPAGSGGRVAEWLAGSVDSLWQSGTHWLLR